MKLGAFFISLNVKDIQKSKSFYEKLGFSVFGGQIENKYLILKNGNSLIGLFQDMFEGNLLTFNPGWNENANTLNDFDDIRTIEKSLKINQITLERETGETKSGPASLVIKDPNGNVILIDQHV